MEMNDILNGLNPCEDSAASDTSTDCCCGPVNNVPAAGVNPVGCGNFGCGFGSWIWILLILFYCGCGTGFAGGNSCCESSCGNNGLLGGMFGNCTAYLFLLVILFLCNSNFSSIAGNCGAGCGGMY